MRKLLFAAALAAAPASAAAASSIIALSRTIQQTIYRPLTAIVISYALLLFLWGIYRYIAQSGDERGAEEGAKMMTYGVVVLFVMTSLWGIVWFSLDALGLPEASTNPTKLQPLPYDNVSPEYNFGNVV